MENAKAYYYLLIKLLNVNLNTLGFPGIPGMPGTTGKLKMRSYNKL